MSDKLLTIADLDAYYDEKLHGKLSIDDDGNWRLAGDVTDGYGNTLRPKAPEVKSFAQATDAEITEMLEAHRAGTIDLTTVWTVGDERKVHLSAMAATGVGESHVEQDQTLVILHGANMFDLSDGGKNIFVIGLKNMLANGTSREGGYINSSNTNVGGWKKSLRRPWCDNVFMSALPAEVQKWFKKFKYYAGKGNQSKESEEMENYFTFASSLEIFESDTYCAPGEGTQFDYYKTSSNRIKKPGDDESASAYIWWLRSPLTNGTTDFRTVISNGTVYVGSASNARGLSPFGCV